MDQNSLREGRSPARPTHRSHRVDTLVDDWLRSLEQGRSEFDAGDGADPVVVEGQATGPAPAIHVVTGGTEDVRGKPPAQPGPWSALAKRQSEGPVVQFSDSLGGSVAVSRSGTIFRHAGTVAVRGPSAPARTVYEAQHLTDEQSQALEFVAAWYGAPFDAANACSDRSHSLCWGFWRFTGENLARCLALWKERAPAPFEELLARHGVDVEAVSDSAESVPRMVLVTRDTAAGSVWRGEAAEREVSRQAPRLAALARAGRERLVQLIQIESVVHDVVKPALALRLPDEEGRTCIGDFLRSATALASGFYVLLQLGAKEWAGLLRSLVAHDPEAPSEIVVLERLVVALYESGRVGVAEEVLRIQTSPELTMR